MAAKIHSDQFNVSLELQNCCKVDNGSLLAILLLQVYLSNIVFIYAPDKQRGTRSSSVILGGEPSCFDIFSIRRSARAALCVRRDTSRPWVSQRSVNGSTMCLWLHRCGWQYVSPCVRARLNSCRPNYRSVCALVTLNLKWAASGDK